MPRHRIGPLARLGYTLCTMGPRMRRAVLVAGVVSFGASALAACASSPDPVVASLPITAATVPVPVPVVEAPIEEPESKSPPRNAERTIARVRPKLRGCYERGLAIDPRMPGGALRVHARVSSDGSVRGVEITKRTGLSTSVASCVADELRATRFDPSAEPSSLDVPVHFVGR